MTWLMMWLNRSVVIINTIVQLLNIYKYRYKKYKFIHLAKNFRPFPKTDWASLSQGWVLDKLFVNGIILEIETLLQNFLETANVKSDY